MNEDNLVGFPRTQGVVSENKSRLDRDARFASQTVAIMVWRPRNSWQNVYFILKWQHNANE